MWKMEWLLLVLVVSYLVTSTNGMADDTGYCHSTPCINGGTCKERVDGFVCECPAQYTGLHCDIINFCNSSPCLHGGKCINRRESYTCDCTGTGYDGFTCHVPHNDCQAGSCLNGGTCVDAFKNFTCRCVPGFTGKKCEVELSACASNPCMHGGTCFDVHAGSSPSQVSPGFQCQCVEGFAGDRCETTYNHCTNNECLHGVCVDGLNTYTCDCTGSGYYGLRCEKKNINQCALQHPCQNGGKCIPDGDDYYCDCLHFKEGHITHGGKNCSVLLRGCEALNICHNGAVCIPVLLNEAKNIHGYNCVCAHGYKGRLCDSVTSMTVDTGSYIRKTYITNYTLSLRFRTSNKNGVLLYDRVGEGFVSVELVNGSLYLSAGNITGITATAEAKTSTSLSDSHWHSLVLNMQNITLTLNDPLCTSTNHCIMSVQFSQSASYFREFFIGQVTVLSWLQGTLSKTGFVGCIQDVSFNTESIVPDNFGVAEFHKIKMNCPNCLAHTCEGQGSCRPSEKTTFECYCAGTLINGHCSEFNGVACDFESGFCGWTKDSSSSRSWTRNQGATGSVSTGPNGDHTTGRGYYIYTEASGHEHESMIMNSPHFDLITTTCLSVWIHMYGSSMGTLKISQLVGHTRYNLYRQSGAMGDRWVRKKFNLYTGSNTYLQLEGTVGSSYYSDMAVDDIQLTTGSC